MSITNPSRYGIVLAISYNVIKYNVKAQNIWGHNGVVVTG